MPALTFVQRWLVLALGGVLWVLGLWLLAIEQPLGLVPIALGFLLWLLGDQAPVAWHVEDDGLVVNGQKMTWLAIRQARVLPGQRRGLVCRPPRLVLEFENGLKPTVSHTVEQPERLIEVLRAQMPIEGPVQEWVLYATIERALGGWLAVRVALVMALFVLVLWIGSWATLAFMVGVVLLESWRVCRALALTKAALS